MKLQSEIANEVKALRFQLVYLKKVVFLPHWIYSENEKERGCDQQSLC